MPRPSNAYPPFTTAIYTDPMLRYAITDGSRFSPAGRIAGLRADATRWAHEAIDFIQLREKSVPAADLLTLATAMLEIFRNAGAPTRLLINHRADIALATRAHGVHLTSHRDELTPTQIRQLFSSAGLPNPTISLSCHTLADVHRATLTKPDLILFGPIFEKRLDPNPPLPGTGLETLHLACEAAAPIPVLALGGITPENTPACLSSGAAGIAAIRLFHQPESATR